MSDETKPVIFLGSSKKDLSKLPASVKDAFAHGIKVASRGKTHPNAKPLKGYHGRGVLELIEDHRGDTFRGVYTVKFKNAVYVLHVFKKKSKSGIATPKRDKELINCDYSHESAFPGERGSQRPQLKGEAHSRSYGRRLQAEGFVAPAPRGSATHVNSYN